MCTTEILRTNDKTKVWINSGKIKIDPDTVCYCQAEGCYTRIYLRSGKAYLLSKPLSAIEKQLPREYFLRCHRSYLINMKEITFVDIKKRLAYQTLYQIPVSWRKLADLLYKRNVYIVSKK